MVKFYFHGSVKSKKTVPGDMPQVPGGIRIIAFIEGEVVIEKILSHLGLPGPCVARRQVESEAKAADARQRPAFYFGLISVSLCG